MKRLKIFWLVLVLFSVLPLQLWSESQSAAVPEIRLTMDEYLTLKSGVQTLKEVSDQKTRYIESLETSLKESKRDTKKTCLKVGLISFSIGFGAGAIAAGITAAYLAN